jgi:hypothetical protein
MNSSGKSALTIIFGLLGIIAPFGAIHVATFMGANEISAFNSTMIMILSVLLIIFLVLNAFGNFMANRKKIFIAGLVLICLNLISFIWNLLIFINM